MNFPDEIRQRLEREFSYYSSRSSGPGGQNVNKVNTRVELRFSIGNSLVFSDEEKEKIRIKLKNRINGRDELVVFAEQNRSQSGNKLLVTEKTFALLESCLKTFPKRIKTKPTVTSKLKRLETKKALSRIKQWRKKPDS